MRVEFRSWFSATGLTPLVHQTPTTSHGAPGSVRLSAGIDAEYYDCAVGGEFRVRNRYSGQKNGISRDPMSQKRMFSGVPTRVKSVNRYWPGP